MGLISIVKELLSAPAEARRLQREVMALRRRCLELRRFDAGPRAAGLATAEEIARLRRIRNESEQA